jgi:hypothetical protein
MAAHGDPARRLSSVTPTVQPVVLATVINWQINVLRVGLRRPLISFKGSMLSNNLMPKGKVLRRSNLSSWAEISFQSGLLFINSPVHSKPAKFHKEELLKVCEA